MGMLKKKTLSIFLTVFAALGSIIMAFPVMATSQTDAGFYVYANLPENQLDKNLTYFDLRMKPEQIQTLEVEITNQLDMPLEIDVEAISASTNRHGIIDYKTPFVRDETLTFPFSNLAKVHETVLTVPARSSKTVAITITMPKESFDGVILGGLTITRKPDKTKDSKTTIINNIFSYVIGVKLSENDVVVDPHFELVKVTPKSVHYQPEFVHAIRNSQASIVKNMDVEVSVTDANGKAWAHANKSNIDMAPNSILPLGAALDGTEFKAGNYTSNVTVKYDNQTFSYQKDFVIASPHANIINDEIITPDSAKTTPWLMIIIVLLLSSIIILLLVLLKQKKDKSLERKDV